jgi:hypothetical protein
MENGSLYYKLQSGDYGAAQISQKFGHGSEFQALMALNPGFPWGTAPVGAKLNVPVAWAYA